MAKERIDAHSIVRFDSCIKWVDTYSFKLADGTVTVRVLLQLTSGDRVACMLPFKNVGALRQLIDNLEREAKHVESLLNTPVPKTEKGCQHRGFKVE